MSRLCRSVLIALAVSALAAQVALAAAPATAAPADRLHGPGIVVGPHRTVLPRDLHAGSWIVVDARTGKVLAARDAHHKYLPASTQKVLTAVTLLPKLKNRHRMVTAVQSDANVDGTRVGLVNHGRYSVEMLFSCMLMMSGNDCAHALARAAGSVRSTVAAMNAKARSLGTKDTYAGTPSGLDAPGQSSSVFDLAIIMRAALKTPDFIRYNSMRTSRVPAQGKKYAGFPFANDNRLRAKGYRGLLAAKNGYTDAARHTYVCAARRGGHTVIVALMHAERNVVDTDDQAASLLDWGFAVDGKIKPVGTIAPAPEPRPAAKPSKQAQGTAHSAAKTPFQATASPDSHSYTTTYVVIAVVVVVLLAVTVAVAIARRRA